MTTYLRQLTNGLKIIGVITLFSLITACSSPINQDNFNKIQKGMTKEQVINILGKPTQENDISIAGISGASSVWKADGNMITVQFVNDKVFTRVFAADNSKQDQNNTTGGNSADSTTGANTANDSTTGGNTANDSTTGGNTAKSNPPGKS